MSFGIGSSAANAALTPLAQYQQRLLDQSSQLSSGKRITSAASDPSGLAIAASLQAQVNGFDQAASNAQDAGNAAAVAEGALSSTSGSLQRLSQLAIQASSDFLSPSQRGNLQTEANQLVQQIDTNAQNTQFNGNQLLDGSFQGTTPATPAAAAVTSNAELSGGGQLANAASAAPAATAETIGLSVVNNGGAIQAQVTTTDTATGTVTAGPLLASGATTTLNGTTFTVGNLSTLDVGTTATIQVTGATAGTTGTGATVQTGANQGATTQLTLPDGSSRALGLVKLDFSSSQTATNAQGQINSALQNLSSARAQVGAQEVSIKTSINNNNIASVNVQQSASDITDLNIGQAATQFASTQLQQQITLNVLHNANNNFGFLNSFFNHTQ